MDRIKRTLFTNQPINQAAQQSRQAAGAKAAPYLGGLTPEQLAQIEKIAARMPAGQLQQTLSGAFAKLDPATLNQIAEKLTAGGSPPPAGGKRTDPATLALLAATAMRGRAGGIAGLLMILAGSAVANRTQDAAPGRTSGASGASSALASAGKSVASALGSVAGKAAEAGSRSSSPRIRTGAAQLQNLTALAGSPLARNVMSQLGPAILKMGSKTPKR
jgi:hypothetical protein